MLEVLKVIILGIVQGITEWLPISSTGHLILVEQLIQLKQSEAFTNMFNVVIQFGSIMAVVVIYFHKLNPFSPTKTEKQKKMTIQLWIKVVIGTIPALIGGVLLNDLIESKLSNAYVVGVLKVSGTFMICNESNGENSKEEKWTKIIQGMKIYNSEQIKKSLEDAGFTDIKIHKNKKGWLCVVCKKG